MMRIATVLGVVVTCHAAAQVQVPRVTVVGVRLLVHVARDGHALSGLTNSDFELEDKGVLQHVDAVRHVDSTSIGLLVDTSVSMRSAAFVAVPNVARCLTDAMAPGDEMAVITVSDHSTLLAPLTSDTNRLETVWNGLRDQPAGFVALSALADGMLFAASEAARGEGAPYIVVVTDGRDNSSWSSLGGAARLLTDVGVVVDVVGLREVWSHSDDSPPGPIQVPEDIARDSEGQFFSARDKRLAQKLSGRLQELRESYVITYVPRNVRQGDGWHPLNVRVRGKGATVKVRAGYYSNGGG